MLRYKTETRPGLVALYDIRPGNGAGPFLQPRSPHGAIAPQLWPTNSLDLHPFHYSIHVLREKMYRNVHLDEIKH